MSGSSKLAQLAKLRAQKKNDEKKVGLVEEGSGKGVGDGTRSKLAKLALARKKVKEPVVEKVVLAVEPLVTQLVTLEGIQLMTQPRVVDPLDPENIDATPLRVDHQITFDDSILLDSPHNPLSSFLLKRPLDDHHFNKSKRGKNSDIFLPFTNNYIEKAKPFEKPSPDDIILNAQDKAFEKLGDLSIKEKKIEKKSTDKKSSVKTTKPFKSVDISHQLQTNPTYLKPHKSFVVIGHVDAGKSTLMGRILYDYGIVDSKTVDKLVKESERIGKGSFALAWIMDQTSEERTRGVTIDICATDFETDNVRFTAIDAPGHKDFVPQMIGGVSKADIALLVVDSIEGEFESGFSLDGQTKEHTILAKNLGILKIVIAVNKLDKINWNQARFEFIKLEMTKFLTSEDVGFDLEQIEVIPISGLSGNNVVKRDDSIEEFKWYEGPTLGSYLENVKLATENTATQLIEEDFLLSVHDSYRDSGLIKVTGKIISGIIQAGETIIVSPTQEVLQVQSIKASTKPVDFAIKGELVTLSFKASQLSNDQIEAFRVGDSISKINSPIKTVKKIQVELHLFNIKKPLLVGTPFIMFRNNCQVPARITELVEIVGGKKKKKLLHLVSKQVAIVNIEIENTSISLTKYEDNKILGRVVIRREGVTIGAGKVVDFIE